METKELRFKLKDNRTAVIRTAHVEDAEGMVAYLFKSAEETEFLMRCPQECNYTVEAERTFLENLEKSEDSALLICLIDGEVAGSAQIDFSSRVKTKHRAEIAIALNKQYWNLGMGTKLFEEMIRLAEKREGLHQMELEVMERNTRAIHLYEKMGFHIVSVHPNAICQPNGEMQNMLLMIREMK